MTSDEVIERLRDWPFMGKAMATATADHIEELIKERDEAWKRAAHAEKMWGEAEVKLAKAMEARMSADPRCARCGHPRSNHHYRHPFVGPSWDDTIKTQANCIEELEAKLSESEALLAKALLIIEAYGDDEGYIPKRVLHLWNELTGGKDE